MCIYIYIHIYAYIYMYICIYKYIYTHVYRFTDDDTFQALNMIRIDTPLLDDTLNKKSIDLNEMDCSVSTELFCVNDDDMYTGMCTIINYAFLAGLHHSCDGIIDSVTPLVVIYLYFLYYKYVK
jgi:hypothetical protein